MKILYVIDSLGTGGAERSTAELWYFLQQENIPFKVIALRTRYEGVQAEVLAAGVDVTILKNENFLDNVRQIVKITRSFKPTHIHSILFKSNLRVRVSKLFYSSFIHMEALVNTSYADERFQDKNVNALVLHSYRWIDCVTGNFLVDHFIANTFNIKVHYMKRVKINPAKISVIYRGRRANPWVNDKYQCRQMLIREFGLPDAAFVFMAVGRQEFQKGLMYTLKAFHKVVEAYPESRLLMVGRRGRSTVELELYCQQHELQTKVYFLGHRSDVAQLLAAADAFVFSSVYEGIGGAIIEALATGLPIISSDLPGLREVITTDNACFVTPKSIPELKDAMIKIILSEALRVKMQLANQELFAARFQLENIHKSIIELYQKTI